jgi:hypothetical protein
MFGSPCFVLFINEHEKCLVWGISFSEGIASAGAQYYVVVLGCDTPE